jgi:hypothetical protein
MFDPYRFGDFAFDLEAHLLEIARNLQAQTYRPQPLRTIDVPKSTLSVRPGSVLAIEDKIVLFALACLIAPPLDRLLPRSVYSWRVKTTAKRDELFEDHEILQLPFLKRVTIQTRVEFVEPWYGQWPRFVEESRLAYEKDGFQYLVLSDIVSYFENVDHVVLRDLLLRHLPRQVRLVNFLIGLLGQWTWPTLHGSPSGRGIPQGFGVSSFLGNIYLLPLDDAFTRMARRGGVRYLRYMDDVKVLARDPATAREALFLMNEVLRSLRLNIQASKTRIFEGQEAKDELWDDRLEAVNALVKETESKNRLSATQRRNYAAQLRVHVREVKGKKGIIRDRELRLFRRLVTGYAMLRHPGVLSLLLQQLDRNPDARLLNSAIRYVRVQPRNLRRIAAALLRLLQKAEGLFPYQTAHLLLGLRYVRDPGAVAFREARVLMSRKSEHPYVRQQAALLLAVRALRPRELKGACKRFERETEVEVRLALMKCLVQLPKDELRILGRQLLLRTDPREQRLGRFLYGLLHDRERGLEQVKSLFRDFREDALLERFFEVDALAKAEASEVRQAVVDGLRRNRRFVRRPRLRERLDRVLELAESDVPTQEATPE